MSDALDIRTERATATHTLAAVEGSVFVAAVLPPAFDGVDLHSGARRVTATPDTIAGSARQWAYLASVAQTLRQPSGGLEAVQIRLRVLEGVVGVGLLDEPGSAFVDVVDGIAAGAITHVTFFVRGMQHVGRLVVRNAGTGPAVFEWLGVESFLLKDEAELLRECLPPRGLAPVPGWSRYYGSFSATPDESIRQLLFDSLQVPLVMPWVHNLGVTITPGEETSRALFVSGTYEPSSMIAVQRFLVPGAVLFDVGANVGLYTLLGSRCVGAAGHVYSFEPSSRERTSLHANLALNDCRNVTVSAAAVGERTGTAALRIAAGEHRGQNTLAPSFASASVGLERTEDVEVVSLDEFARAPGVRRPDVLKIDAEGTDLLVLRGARSILRETMPVIVFEINDTLLQATGASRHEVEAFLHDLGYAIFRVDERDASLLRVSTLRDEQSENFVATPER